MIVKNNLLNFKDKIIYQDTDFFSFSLDSLLLVNFVTLNPSTKKIIDLASGNAPIPMLLTYKIKAKIYGVEIQKEVFELGKKSIIENKMDKQIAFINEDVKNIPKLFESDYFDVIVSNPPYFKKNEVGYMNDNKVKAIARHEIMLELDDIFKVAKKVLKNNGVIAIVHRPSRFVEIIDKMREYGIEPKRVQFVYPKNSKESNILLIEGIKNGKPGLKVLEPLIVHNEDGSYTDEIKNMFGE